MSRGDQGLQIVIDPQEWYRLKQELDAFDPALAKGLRKRIRDAGEVARKAVIAELREATPDGDTDLGGRLALIQATKMTVSFAKKAAGARIATGSNRLSAAHKGLLNVYNKTQFRHPVFGDRSDWVPQKGRPYFGAPIVKSINAKVIQEIWDALDDATKAIGARAR